MRFTKIHETSRCSLIHFVYPGGTRGATIIGKSGTGGPLSDGFCCFFASFAALQECDAVMKVSKLKLQCPLDRRARGHFFRPAIDVREAFAQLGQRALAARVPRIEREVGERDLV